MGNMTTKHYAVLAAMLVSLGTQLSGLEHGWADATSPAFIGGLFMQLGTTVAALFVGAPRDPDLRERRTETHITPFRP